MNYLTNAQIEARLECSSKIARVNTFLGRGAESAVFSVDMDIGQGTNEYHIKVLAPSKLMLKYCNSDRILSTLRMGIVNDARTQKKLSNLTPNVRSGYLNGKSTFKTGDLEFVAFDPIHGKSLDNYLFDFRRKNTTPLCRVVAKTMLPVATALQVAHEQTPSIVHADVKTENILLTNANKIYLIDFSHALTRKNNSGILTGSPAYLAPEILA